MARKQKGQKTPNFSLHAKSNGSGSSKGKKLESYEDTLEPGGTDEHIFRRDQILFNPQDESDGDDDMGPEGEEVLSLNLPRRKDTEEEEEEDQGEYVDEEEMPAVAPKSKAQKKKEDLKTKGRFGKAVESSDDEDLASGSGSGSGSGSEDEDEEGWGRSYYSRPSSRKEKEELRGEYDESKEEARELELQEVKRLQRKSREKLAGDDWGLVELEDVAEEAPVQTEEKVSRAVAPTPKSSDPATLIRHLESNEPVKLALARDLPLTIRIVEKTARGIKKMMNEEEGQESLHKGLGWLHYQSLLAYATTLAFYVHLASLPPSQRPDLADHPIINRLLELKKAVSDLQELDFAAGSVSDGDPLVQDLADKMGLNGDGEIDLSTEEKKLAFMELLNKMREADGSGVEVMGGEEDDEDEEDEDEDDGDGDFDDSWKIPGLEEDELDDLIADANGEDVYPDTIKTTSDKGKKLKVKSTSIPKEKKSKKSSSTESEEGGKKKRSRKPKPDPSTPIGSFTPLAEPEFYSSESTKSKKGKSSRPTQISADDDTLGDATALLDADATDKERRTKSLRFHTSKIASQSARRAAARAQRSGGDEDIPRRDRQKARDAALRKNSANSQDGGEDLDMDGPGGEWSESERKRAREVREDGPDEAEIDDGANDYYDLVKRRKTEKQAEKEAAHQDRRAEKFASFEEESADGPRALTRAIEKNRGLTPRRNKAGRNPRVKKRQAYEKAKQKVGSQRAVYKGGQATVGGNYAGEKTGISTVVKSRKF